MLLLNPPVGEWKHINGGTEFAFVLPQFHFGLKAVLLQCYKSS